MLKAAKEFLINNPTLDLKAFKEANPGITVVLQNKAGRDKPPQVAIRTKTKPGYRDWTEGKTVEEQEYIKNFKKETTNIRKQESESLLHRYSTGASDKSKIYSITEHNQQGGDPTDLSRSDPFFKEHKDKLERRLTADFGDDMRVGVNSQGETIFGPSKSWNELDPERSPGVQTLYQGQELPKGRIETPDKVRAIANRVGQRAYKTGSYRVGGMLKATTGLSRGESLLRIIGGDYVGGSLGLAMTTPTFQKKAAALLAKQGVKLIPGVSLGSGALQAAGYVAKGQFTKAGLSAIGGVLGELGPAGDAAQAAIDVGLTASDMKVGKKAKLKTKVPDEDDLFETLRRTGKFIDRYGI